MTGKIKDEYDDAACPDCGEDIPDDANEGEECSNCGHVWGFCSPADDDWKRDLRSGDEITWNDPDDGLCTKTFVMQSIEYLSDDVVRITDKDGGVLEAHLHELS